MWKLERSPLPPARVEIDGVNVKEGQIISLLNGKLVLASDNLKDATFGLLKKAHADHFELITLFYGARCDPAWKWMQSLIPSVRNFLSRKLRSRMVDNLIINSSSRLSEISLNTNFMPRTCILTDSTAYFTKSAFAGQEHVIILPHLIQVNDQYLQDSKDLSIYYHLTTQLIQPPITIPPSIDAFQQCLCFFRDEVYKEIVVILLSSHLSQAIANAQLQFRHVKALPIFSSSIPSILPLGWVYWSRLLQNLPIAVIPGLKSTALSGE